MPRPLHGRIGGDGSGHIIFSEDGLLRDTEDTGSGHVVLQDERSGRIVHESRPGTGSLGGHVELGRTQRGSASEGSNSTTEPSTSEVTVRHEGGLDSTAKHGVVAVDGAPLIEHHGLGASACEVGVEEGVAAEDVLSIGADCACELEDLRVPELDEEVVGCTRRLSDNN